MNRPADSHVVSLVGHNHYAVDLVHSDQFLEVRSEADGVDVGIFLNGLADLGYQVVSVGHRLVLSR